MTHAAYWASWADALHMIAGRLEVANRVVDEFEGEDQDGCLAEVSAAADRLDRQGFAGRPSWADLKEGVRPPDPVSQEPGEWQHGWQHHASSSEYHCREPTRLAVTLCPTQLEFQLQPGIFRTLSTCGLQ